MIIGIYALVILIVLALVGKYSYRFFWQKSIKQVNEGFVAYIRHWGRVQRDAKGRPKMLRSGFYRVNPISKRIDVLPSPERKLYQDLTPMKFFTNDNATLTVVARIQYQISDPYVYRYQADNPILQVSTIIQANLRKAINSLSFQQAIGQASIIGQVISDSIKDKNPLIVEALVKTAKQKGQNLKGQELTKAINAKQQELQQEMQAKNDKHQQEQDAIRKQIAGYGISVSQATLKEIRPDTDLLDRMNQRKEADLQAQANVAKANGEKSVATVQAQGSASAEIASASGSEGKANIDADASAYARTKSASAESSAASMSANAESNVQTVHAKAASNALSMSADAAANSTAVSAKAKAGAISSIADANSGMIAKKGKAYNNMGSSYLAALAINQYASAIGHIGDSKSHVIADLGQKGNLISRMITALGVYRNIGGLKGLSNANHSINKPASANKNVSKK